MDLSWLAWDEIGSFYSVSHPPISKQINRGGGGVKSVSQSSNVQKGSKSQRQLSNLANITRLIPSFVTRMMTHDDGDEIYGTHQHDSRTAIQINGCDETP